jgi:hypothetical protein
MGDFLDFKDYIEKYPQFIYDLNSITLCSCFGQLFIYYVIEKLGPYILSIITTTRFI